MRSVTLFFFLACCSASVCCVSKESLGAAKNLRSLPTRNPIVEFASSSKLSKLSWKSHNYSTEIFVGKKNPPPIGYTKGMALVYADIYRRHKLGENLILRLSNSANDSNPRDGLYHFRAKFLAQGVDVGEGGVKNLRALFALLFELGIRESDGRYYLGLDDGRYKPNELINADTTEAGLFQSSWNYSYQNNIAKEVFEQHRKADGREWLEVFKESVSPPRNNNDRSVGDGIGLEFQKLAKSNPNFAVEFAAHTVRRMGASGYFFIRYDLMDISPEALSFFAEIESIVDTE